MDNYLITQFGRESFIVQKKLEGDGMDPALHEFKNRADAENWIAEQKSRYRAEGTSVHQDVRSFSHKPCRDHD